MRSDSAAGLSIPKGELGFDLHGLIGVEVVDATPDDIRAVGRQLGAKPRPSLDRRADIRIRFAPHIDTRELRYVEAGRSGFTADAFLLREGRTSSAWAQIPFEALDERPIEIVCRSGARSVPLLVELLRFAALRRNVLPLHASAFRYRGVGVLAAGWAHSGKTSALLAFAERGAEVLSDDLVLLDVEGGGMFGVPTPLELAGWQVRQVPRAWSTLGSRHRLALRTQGVLERIERRNASRADPRSRHILGSLLPGIERRLRTCIRPDLLYPGILEEESPRPSKLFIMLTHEKDEIRVEPADPAESLGRMINLARYEGLSLLSTYLAFGFAFPGSRGDGLDRLAEIESELLRHALSGLDIYVVTHPRPVSFDRLFEAMEPACLAGSPVAAAAAVP